MCSQKFFGETCAVLREQALEISGQQVDFNIDGVTDEVFANDRLRCRVRNDIRIEAACRYLVNGKANTIDANGTFLRDVARVLLRNFDADSN